MASSVGVVSAIYVLLSTAVVADFKYEIDRAKATVNVYGSHIFRDERVHTRIGTLGSTIETYCATVQYRDHENRVQEAPFFWILRVRPASGFLTDYQRGAWAGAAAGKVEDYQKLCVSSEKQGDSDLLRSTFHSSDGSLYDPTNDVEKVLTSDWLIGAWVFGENCASSRDELFRSDRHYEGSSGIGTWDVKDFKVHLKIEKREHLGEDGEIIRIESFAAPKLQILNMERTGFDSAGVNGTTHYIRC